MLRLNLHEKKDESDSSSEKFSDCKDQAPLSSTKRRLLEAKEKDAYFDREVKAVETSQVVRALSKQFVADALSSASTVLLTPRRSSDTKK